MAWNEETYREALRLRDEFEKEIQRDTAEAIARAQRQPGIVKRALFWLFPDFKRATQTTNEALVVNFRANLRASAKRGAQQRIAMKGLSQQQRAQLGYYLIGTPSEGNALLDELNEMGS